MSETEAFSLMDDMSEFGVEHAVELALLDRKPRAHGPVDSEGGELDAKGGVL